MATDLMPTKHLERSARLRILPVACDVSFLDEQTLVGERWRLV